jgi:hypothetical protein
LRMLLLVLSLSSSFPGRKTARNWSWPLTSIYSKVLECVEFCFHSLLCLHWVVLRHNNNNFFTVIATTFIIIIVINIVTIILILWDYCCCCYYFNYYCCITFFTIIFIRCSSCSSVSKHLMVHALVWARNTLWACSCMSVGCIFPTGVGNLHD